MLGCIQPMSSPMMKRMLGFCVCCAAAGVLATATAESIVSKPRQIVVMNALDFIVLLLVLDAFRWPRGSRGRSYFAPCVVMTPLALGATRLNFWLRRPEHLSSDGVRKNQMMHYVIDRDLYVRTIACFANNGHSRG